MNILSLALIASAIFINSCTIPRVIILEDKLTAEEHVDLGYIYERQGKLDLAEQEYKKAMKKDRKNFVAYFNLGNVYAKRGDYERAEVYYRKAIKLKEDPDALNNLAYVLYKQGKKEEALAYIRRALELREDPTYKDTLDSILKE